MNPYIGIGLIIAGVAAILFSERKDDGGKTRENGHHGGSSRGTGQQGTGNRQHGREGLAITVGGIPVTQNPQEKESKNEVVAERQAIREIRGGSTGNDFCAESVADAHEPRQAEERDSVSEAVDDAIDTHVRKVANPDTESE